MHTCHVPRGRPAAPSCSPSLLRRAWVPRAQPSAWADFAPSVCPFVHADMQPSVLYSDPFRWPLGTGQLVGFQYHRQCGDGFAPGACYRSLPHFLPVLLPSCVCVRVCVRVCVCVCACLLSWPLLIRVPVSDGGGWSVLFRDYLCITTSCHAKHKV